MHEDSGSSEADSLTIDQSIGRGDAPSERAEFLVREAGSRIIAAGARPPGEPPTDKPSMMARHRLKDDQVLNSEEAKAAVLSALRITVVRNRPRPVQMSNAVVTRHASRSASTRDDLIAARSGGGEATRNGGGATRGGGGATRRGGEATRSDGGATREGGRTSGRSAFTGHQKRWRSLHHQKRRRGRLHR